MDELNKKLAIWRFPTCEVEHFDYDNGEIRLSNRALTVPDDAFEDGIAPHFWSVGVFTQSLDACDKWLMPKLGSIVLWKAKLWAVDVSKDSPIYHAAADTLSLAFCLAVEKLIDGSK
ncbi:hypothetical protein LCGC14_1452500 [marine sediment metagenome]|uniref:Uncharacterized protein n=1 Tax=marine sediment metagenome TaxID=412755 RepID=A0A0F9JIA1_9ZZZZ|nr:hypothetical protein [Pricia sp.]